MISRRDYIMDMIEKFTAFLLQLTGLRAIGAHQAALDQLDTYLVDFFGMTESEPERALYHLGHGSIDPQALYVLPVLIKERTILLFHLHRPQEANTSLRLLLALITKYKAELDSDRIKRTLLELCRETRANQLAPDSFAALVPVLSEYTLFAKADDLIFEYLAIQENSDTRLIAGNFYAYLLTAEETILANGNFSRDEAQEAIEALQLDIGKT